MKASDSLVAQVTNNSTTAQQGRIVLVASGLDGRLVELEVGKFNLAASSSSDVAVPINRLPVQSEVATSFASLYVEFNRGKEVLRPSRTRPFYYIFSGGYAQAELYTTEEVVKLPNGGLRTTDTMDVRGRVLDATGAAQEVMKSAVSGDSRQGLSRIGTKRARPANPPAFATTQTASSAGSSALAAASSVTHYMRLFWPIAYSDSGLGEDVYSISGWQAQQAAYTWIAIYSLDYTINYYNQPVDRNGRNYFSINLPPSTQLVVHVWTDWMRDEAGTEFNSWMSSDGTILSATATEGDIYFTTSARTSGYTETRLLTFPYNTDAVQTAAIAGLVLKTNNYPNRVLGIVPGSRYNMYANLGCPKNTGWVYPANYEQYKSCYNATADGTPSVWYGPFSGGNNSEPGAWWKFIVAHEIGHAVQARGLGDLGAIDYDQGDDPTKKACQCGHVSNPAVRAHCLNSREAFNVAEIEGFGHFFATKLFNNDTQANATMVYYKEFQNSEDPDDVTGPPMAKDGFGNIQRQWMQNHCTTPLTGFGTEYDWLQFYYDIGSRDSGRAATCTPVPNLFNIYKVACGDINGNALCSGQNPSWITIRDAAAEIYGPFDARYQRFLNAGDYHAVNY